MGEKQRSPLCLRVTGRRHPTRSLLLATLPNSAHNQFLPVMILAEANVFGQTLR
jgi:hypothetical protein